MNGNIEISSDNINHVYIKGKKCKLSVFPHNHFGTFIEDDLFLNKDDFPSISVGDVVEIYNPDPECDDYRPRLLLKVFTLLQ